MSYLIGEEAANFVDGKPVPQLGGVKIGKNVYAQAFSVVARGIKENDLTIIGDGCYLSPLSYVGSNAVLGNNCFLSVGAKVLGKCILGDHVYVGSNAVITPRCKIGRWVKIRAGEVVNCNIPDHTYYGKNGRMVPNRDSPLIKRVHLIKV